MGWGFRDPATRLPFPAPRSIVLRASATGSLGVKAHAPAFTRLRRAFLDTAFILPLFLWGGGGVTAETCSIHSKWPFLSDVRTPFLTWRFFHPFPPLCFFLFPLQRCFFLWGGVLPTRFLKPRKLNPCASRKEALVTQPHSTWPRSPVAP